MPLSCYVPSQIIPKSRVVHLADKQILKRHIQSYPKIIVSNWGGGGGGGGGFRYLAHGLMSLAFVLLDFQHAGVRRRAWCTRQNVDM